MQDPFEQDPFEQPAPMRYDIEQRSDKDFVATLLLCFFLGSLGVHRFYVGKVGTGILMLLTFGGFGIWFIIDLIMIVTGNFKDKYGRYIKN